MKDFNKFSQQIYTALEKICLANNASKQDIWEAIDEFETKFFKINNVKDENEENMM